MVKTAFTANDIVLAVDPDTMSRSYSCVSILRSFDKNTGTLKFVSKSSSSANQWEQEIRILDLGIVPSEELENIKTFQELITNFPEISESDILVDCNCPSYLFDFNFLCTDYEISIKPQSQAPKVRNTEKRGMVCKHLTNVLKEFFV